MVLSRIDHLADSCALHESSAGTLDADPELDRQVREFKLGLLFLPLEKTAHEAGRSLDFLARVRETETRLLEQVVWIVGFV
ncbi:hypothetical protein ACGFWF_29195 [Streptomyces sp. NPDC048581]|uniref:hypothetical protein n=1 Tax=Streptomyces sp. NPDC048581 TaxID=3365572 RepID=UPI003714161A